MNIALDYDDTYTLDPKFWAGFCTMATQHGHSVVIVTRRFREDKVKLLTPVNVIYTNQQPKRKYCENLGLYFDVWIDDLPEGIGGEIPKDLLLTTARGKKGEHDNE